MEVVPQTRKIRVAMETLGCKLNQAESENIARQLTQSGCQIVGTGEKADIYILNTCTVTHVADRKSRHLLRMAHRNNPGARIIALGCYAERAAGELSRIKEVDIIAGNRDKLDFRQLLIDRGYLEASGTGFDADYPCRTRSFLKIQDGCNQYCSYCIVPLVRGGEKSLPPEQIMAGVQQRVNEGYREVVLTGTEIGCYQYSGINLKRLLEHILRDTDIHRIRLSSIQPQEIAPEFLKIWQNPRLCRHFHISLQSGSDTVLRRMHRLYTSEDFSRALASVRSEIPDAAVTTDVIVGFPGETEEEFGASYDFCQRMEFSRIHVFPFSPREGTAAAHMSGQIEFLLKKQRSGKMLVLAGTSLRSYGRRFLGQTRDVLFEQGSQGLYSGLTDNYIKVYAKSTVDLTNRLLPVRLVGLRGDGVTGEIVE